MWSAISHVVSGWSSQTGEETSHKSADGSEFTRVFGSLTQSGHDEAQENLKKGLAEAEFAPVTADAAADVLADEPAPPTVSAVVEASASPRLLPDRQAMPKTRSPQSDSLTLHASPDPLSTTEASEKKLNLSSLPQANGSHQVLSEPTKSTTPDADHSQGTKAVRGDALSPPIQTMAKQDQPRHRDVDALPAERENPGPSLPARKPMNQAPVGSLGETETSMRLGSPRDADQAGIQEVPSRVQTFGAFKDTVLERGTVRSAEGSRAALPSPLEARVLPSRATAVELGGSKPEGRAVEADRPAQNTLRTPAPEEAITAKRRGTGGAPFIHNPRGNLRQTLASEDSVDKVQATRERAKASGPPKATPFTTYANESASQHVSRVEKRPASPQRVSEEISQRPPTKTTVNPGPSPHSPTMKTESTRAFQEPDAKPGADPMRLTGSLEPPKAADPLQTTAAQSTHRDSSSTRPSPEPLSMPMAAREAEAHASPRNEARVSHSGQAKEPQPITAGRLQSVSTGQASELAPRARNANAPTSSSTASTNIPESEIAVTNSGQPARNLTGTSQQGDLGGPGLEALTSEERRQGHELRSTSAPQTTPIDAPNARAPKPGGAPAVPNSSASPNPLHGAQTTPIAQGLETPILSENGASDGLIAEQRAASPEGARDLGVIPAKAVANPIRLALQSGLGNSGGEIEVELSPAELGRVRISFTPSEAGLSITVFAERLETAEMVRRHLGLLTDELESAGFEKLSVDVQSQDPQAKGYQRADRNDVMPINDPAEPPVQQETGKRNVDHGSPMKTTSIDLRL